jgi:predicted TIM-barrel fold metal-dependent hydrolase
MRERELFVQVYASASSWARVAPVLMEAQVRVIVDHMGEPDVRAGIDQPGFSDVLALGRSGRACVKLSAPYRIARTPAPFEDVVPYARACLAAFGAERCLWGSDWPFLAAPRATTYGEQQAWLEAAVPEAATRRLILVDNPRRLFGMRGAGVEAVA